MKCLLLSAARMTLATLCNLFSYVSYFKLEKSELWEIRNSLVRTSVCCFDSFSKLIATSKVRLVLKKDKMLYDSFCGLNVNLIKTGVVIGVVDILSIFIEIFDDLKFYFEGKANRQNR